MANKYVGFVSDGQLLEYIGNVHNAYIRAKNNITKKNFYSPRTVILEKNR